MPSRRLEAANLGTGCGMRYIRGAQKEVGLPEISRSYLQDQVYQLTRKRIEAHTYGPGHRLSEAGLAQELGVSRMPVRDALRRLQLEGLVEGGSGRGLVVAPISLAHARDVYRLRELLETVAVELAVDRATAEDLAKLKATVSAQEKAAASGAIGKVLRASMAFHDALYESAHSTILTLVLEQVWAHARRYRELTLGKLERRQLSTAEHRRLIVAIESHDAETASLVIKQHVAGALAVVAEQMFQVGRGKAPTNHRRRAAADEAVPQSLSGDG